MKQKLQSPCFENLTKKLAQVMNMSFINRANIYKIWDLNKVVIIIIIESAYQNFIWNLSVFTKIVDKKVRNTYLV